MDEHPSTARTADEATDSRLDLLLEQYDAALAAGAAASSVPLGPAEAELGAELAEAKACVALLHRRFPRPPKAEAFDFTSLGFSDDEARFPIQFGRFLVQETLGQGGFGIVYRAHDPALSRDVALKVMRPELLAGTRAHARFLREGQTAAKLHHPHLVTVLEAGEVGPICYLASEYCPGPTLARWLRDRTGPVAIDDAVRIALRLSQAVGYMHERGVVHRDIKPGNVLLVEELDGAAVRGELAALVPKLTDFGLAKSHEDQGSMTRTGVPLGTLAYMAPEQFGPQGNEIGPRADVYSLGVVLYELLTGSNPFQGTTTAETLRLASAEARPLTAVRHDVPRDLAAIVAKCLERDPARRYASGNELADDLRRFAEGQPVQARPLSNMQRLARWTRKNPGLAAALGCCVVLVGAIIGGTAWHAHRLNVVLTDLRTKQGNELEQEYVGAYQAATLAVERNEFHEARELLDEYAQPDPDIRDPRGPEWYSLRRIVDPQVPRLVLPHDSRIWCIDVSEDGRMAATSEASGHIHLWDLATGLELSRWKAHEVEANAVRFIPGHSLLISTGQWESLRIWEVPSGKMLLDQKVHEGTCLGLRISPDGQYLATGSKDREVWLWRLADLVAAAQSTESAPAIEPIHKFAIGDRVYDVNFTPDGQRLVVATEIGFRVWSLDSRGELFRGLDARPAGKLFKVPLSPSGRWLVTGGNWYQSPDGTAQPREVRLTEEGMARCKEGLWVYDLENRRIHDQLVTGELQFSMDQSPDGRWIASGGANGMGNVWRAIGTDFDQLQEYKFAAHESGIWAMRFSPDSQTLLTGAEDGLVKVWQLDDLAEPLRMRLLVHDSGVIEVAYSASGEEMVAACGNGDRAYMRRRGSGYEVATREKSPFAVAARFTRDLGSSVIATPARPRLSALQRGNPKPLWTHEVDGLRREFELSADERVVTIVAEIDEQRRYARTYDTLSGTSGAETQLPDGLNYAAVLRGGRGVIGRTTNGISILDFAKDKVDEVKYSQPFTTSASAFSSKSPLYAVGTTLGELLILSGDEARPVWSHAVSDTFILALAFSADDRLLAASSLDGTVTVIHLASRQVLTTQQLHPLIPVRLCFSPDSSELACGLRGNELLGRGGVIVLNLGFGAPR